MIMYIISTLYFFVGFFSEYNSSYKKNKKNTKCLNLISKSDTVSNALASLGILHPLVRCDSELLTRC